MIIVKNTIMRVLSLGVLILSASCMASLCDEISQTTRLLKNGELQLENQHYLASIALFDRGIDQIGDRYLSDNVSDDTGTKLILSKLVQKEGKLSQAAYLRQGVLSSRLSLFNENNKGFCQ